MSHYIHGSAPEEQARLSRLNQLINIRCQPHFRLETGHRVLDMGSGLGQFTNWMAERVGSTGYCLGIERDEKQRQVAIGNFRAPNLEFRHGDVCEQALVKSEIGSFDFVHMRFLLEHLSNPARAIEQAAQALKSGGRILLFDDDHETMVLYPEPPGFKDLWTAYMDSYLEVGNDPFIGRKLPKLLRDGGFASIYNDVVFFGDCFGTETFQLFAINLIEVIGTSKEIMLESKLIRAEAFEVAIQNLWKWCQQEDASMWYTIAVAGGVKPFN